MAQVHLRYENHQLRTIILHAWIAILLANSARLLANLVILLQKLSKTHSKATQKAAYDHSKPDFRDKSAQLIKTIVQLNIHSNETAEIFRFILRFFPHYPFTLA